MISFGDNSIVYANPACLAIYGVQNLAELGLATVARTIPKAERIKVARLLYEIQNGQEDDATFEATRHRADGTPISPGDFSRP